MAPIFVNFGVLGVPLGALGAKSTPGPHRLDPGTPFLAILVPKGSPRGSQNGAQIDKKWKQKSIKILIRLGVDFWSDFGGFWEGKWSQVGTKMGPKIDTGAKAEKSTKH